MLAFVKKNNYKHQTTTFQKFRQLLNLILNQHACKIINVFILLLTSGQCPFVRSVFSITAAML
jgi:hypothetical protein